MRDANSKTETASWSLVAPIRLFGEHFGAITMQHASRNGCRGLELFYHVDHVSFGTVAR